MSKFICYEKDRNRFRVTFPTPEGKRIVKRFRTQDEAEKWLAEAVTDISRGDFVTPHSVTVGEWIIEYLQTYSKPKVRPRTYERLLQTAAKLEPIAHLKLQQITTMQIQKLYNGLNQSASSNRKVHILLNAAMEKAVAVELLKKNPCKATDYPKEVQTKIEIFTSEEISQLLHSIEQSEHYAEYYPFFRLAVVTGCRLGELLGLKIKAVRKGFIRIENNLQQLASGKVIDQPPKTQAGVRDVSIDEGTERVLREFIKHQGNAPINNYIFVTKNGTPKTPSNMEKVWKAVLIEAGLPHRRFHSLRHTVATMLLAKGEPLLEVSHRLGHSKPTQTLTLYGHAIKGYDRQIADTVTQIYNL